MLTQLNFKAPSVEMTNLSNLWFQLSNTSCNLKCKHCYLSCFPNEKSKNFLSLDKIKSALEESKKLNIEEIYLHGGEPLIHPDINSIIRMCLKHANVTILTNGILINDKKARFLRQIEQDHDNELIFRVSLDHYIEEKNDDIRGRGSYKKIVSCLENLSRYGFNPIISAVNIWNEDIESLKTGFGEILHKIGIEADDTNLKIIPPVKLGEYAKNFEIYAENEFVVPGEIEKNSFCNFDCSSSRVVTDSGVYVCPILVNDPRGKLGTTLSDSSKKFFLETNACYTCVSHSIGIFNNDWSEVN